MTLIIRCRRGDNVDQFPVEGTLRIGRDETCTLRLPGLSVARHHAGLEAVSDASLRLTCRSALGVEVNGRMVHEDTVVMVGDRFCIGPHSGRLTIDPDSGGLMLDVDIIDVRGGDSGASVTTDLSSAGWRMRRPAVVMAAAIVLLLLIVPLLSRGLTLPPALEQVLPTDTMWSSGRISNAHQHFSHDCASCHEKLFVRVRDDACLACHEGIGHHSDHPLMADLAPLNEQRCASCHREHGGTHAVLPMHPGVCVDCHRAPHKFSDFGDMLAVRDFERAHPEFRATVTEVEDGQPVSRRVTLDEGLKDRTGLIFPHDLHLAPDGVLGPDGVEVMACADCHRPDAGRVGFREITYQAHCRDCHELDIGVGDRMLRLPHADEELVRDLLENTLATLPLEAFSPSPDFGQRRRAGPAAARGAAPTAEELIEEVFSTRVCAKCHEIQRDEQGQLAARDVVLRSSWFVHARFTHADHTWVACADCHAAETSADADDLLLPGIATCRQCHGGVKSSQGIRSRCIDCHGFHVADDLVMGMAKGGIADDLSAPMVSGVRDCDGASDCDDVMYGRPQ